MECNIRGIFDIGGVVGLFFGFGVFEIRAQLLNNTLLLFLLNLYQPMKNNISQPSTPSGLFSARLRLCSINSPFISPLRIIPSPYINEPSFSDNHQAISELNQFQLEDNPPVQKENQEQVPENEEEEEEIELVLPEPDVEESLLLDESNMLDFILNNLNRHPKKIETARQGLEGYGSQFNKRLFDYLISKFKKLRKTKEEMVKYCVRKSFKHITNKMRAANKEAYSAMENNEVVAEYFENHCEGDLSISMPFKKDSEEKTMNSNFLKKIFKCRQYNADYKEFLRQFPTDFSTDNKKKIKSMNDAIKKCVKNKCFKSLDQYKRLPWTTEILQKIFEFAKRLMEHSPYRKDNGEKGQSLKLEQQKSEKQGVELPFHIQFNNEGDSHLKVPTKKNVIILTPPARPLEEPKNISDDEPLE